MYTLFGFGILFIFLSIYLRRKRIKRRLNIYRDLDTKLNIDTDLVIFMYTKKAYLKSITWKTKKKRVLNRDKYKCVLCGVSEALDVHHTYGYYMIPNEPITCLVSLCRKCHEHQHKIYGFPSTFDDYMKWNAPLKNLQ